MLEKEWPENAIIFLNPNKLLTFCTRACFLSFIAFIPP